MNMDDLNLENKAVQESAPETNAAPAEESAPAEEQITMGDDGELNIPDSFFEGLGEEEKTPEDKPEPEAKPGAEESAEPAYYTPEEFAAAFASGSVDEAKLRPEVAEFYKAAVKQQPAPPVQPPQPPVQAGAPVMTPQQYATLREAAKRIAAQNFLGIKPEEFDDMEPTHAEAARFAMGQLQARAREIAVSRAAEEARAQRLTEEIRSLDAEYSRKDPEFFKSHEARLHDYIGRMPYREATEAIRAIQSGDAAGIRKLIAGVYADYKASAAKTGQKAAAPPPPPVMKAGGSAEEGERAGMVDVSKLGEMSPEEQAEWLVKNKFAV